MRDAVETLRRSGVLETPPTFFECATAAAFELFRDAGVAIAVLEAGRLKAALYVTRSGTLPDRDWLIAQLAAASPATSVELLAGRPAVPLPDRGPIVCACFDVGINTIVEAIAGQGLVSVEAVGLTLSAGTNCGSCKPAIRRLIGETRAASEEAASA